MRFPKLRTALVHFEAFAGVLIARIALWVAPAPRVLRATERLARRSTGARPVDLTLPRRLGRAVDRVSGVIPAATCLPRALAARVILARAGFSDAIVRIGVARNEAGEFEAHAWVEVDGQLIVGATDREFHAFPDHRSALFAAGEDSATETPARDPARSESNS